MRTVWEDFIKRREPGAWGQFWINDIGEICYESFGIPILHTAIPKFPDNRRRKGGLPAVARFDPGHIGENKIDMETETGASAEGILLSRQFAGGLPSESDPRILDGPFYEMDVMEKDAHDFLRRTQDDAENQSTARKVAENVIVAIALCRQKAFHVLSYSNQSMEEWGALWLYFTGECMHAAALHQVIEAMESKITKEAAATSRKFIEGKSVGGKKSEDREQLISKMVELLTENPTIDSRRAFRRLGCTKSPTGDYEVPGIGLRKLSTLSACWTEARAKSKKDSRSPRDIESSG